MVIILPVTGLTERSSFSVEKEAKRLSSICLCVMPGQRDESFLVLFFKKERACLRAGEPADDVFEQAGDRAVEFSVAPEAAAEGDGADGEDGAAGWGVEIDDFAAHQFVGVFA